MITALSEVTRGRFLATVGALLLVLNFGLFFNGLQNGFTFDDEFVIVKSPYTQDLSRVVDIFTAPNWTGDRKVKNTYRPLTVVSFAANAAVLPGAPPMRVVNVGLHALTCLLVLVLAWQLLGRKDIALATALLFSAHPLHVEDVTSLVGRAEVMSTLFSLLACVLFLESVRNARHAHGTTLRVVAAGAYLLGMLSKESAIPTVALLGILYLHALQNRPGGLRSSTPREHVANAVPFLLAFSVYFLARHNAMGVFISTHLHATTRLDNPLFHVSFLERELTALSVFGRYLTLFVFPARLSADYSYDAIPVVTTPWTLEVLLPTALLVGALGWLLASLWRKSVVGVVLSLWLVPYALFSNLLLLVGTIMADRLMYMPSVGLCLLVSILLLDPSRLRASLPFRLPTWHQQAAWTVVVAATLALGARTVARNRDWKDDFTLFSSALEVVPGSAKVRFNLALAHARRGEDAQALQHAERALALLSDYPDARILVGNLYQRTGQAQKAAEVFQDGQVPTSGEKARLTQAGLLQAQQKWEELLALSQEGLRRNANDVNMLGYQATALYGLKRYREVEPVLLKAASLTPERPIFHQHLGVLYAEQLGDLGRALQHLRKAVELERRPDEVAKLRTMITKVEAAHAGGGH
ncbi:MAG: DUF1736 domain-containing protein [Myxococcota bacterium]